MNAGKPAGHIQAKVLIQFADNEPVVIGRVNTPLYMSPRSTMAFDVDFSELLEALKTTASIFEPAKEES